MLRTRLLTATAAIALFGAGSAFAQEQTAPTAAPATPAPAEAAQPQTPAAGNTVVDVLRAQGQFSTLLSALDAAQLTETLTTQPAVSIFAPTDAASPPCRKRSARACWIRPTSMSCASCCCIM